jgi:hypothetical protein
MLSVHQETIRVLVSTDEGIQLIQSTFDGEWTQKQLDTTLALGVADVAALSDGRLVRLLRHGLNQRGLRLSHSAGVGVRRHNMRARSTRAAACLALRATPSPD